MGFRNKKRKRAFKWRAKKEAMSREPDALRRAVGLPTDYELIKGDGRPATGMLNAQERTSSGR